MIIVWKGAGGLVILIGILACLLMNIITAAMFHQSDYFQAYLWPKLAALWVTGVSCWFLGRYFNGRAARTVIDKRTGQQVLEKPYHHLMFIKLEYWGVIFVAIGLGLLLYHLAS